MKAESNILKEIDRLFAEYEKEVNHLGENGILERNTVNTYLGYADKFVRWCNGNFEPGVKKKEVVIEPSFMTNKKGRIDGL